MTAPVVPSSPPSPPQVLRISGIDWRTYSGLLHLFAEQPGIRMAYDRGELEMMAPLFEHGKDGHFLARMIHSLTEEMGLPLIGADSVTLRRKSRQRGIEPDECFWIANAARMTGHRRLDLRTDPPPDLVVEVEVTHSALDRLGIYAVLGVPEIWRLAGDDLTFHVLRPDGLYESASVSRSFPMVSPADLMGFLQLARQASDDNLVIRQFRAWVRSRVSSREPEA